MPLLNNTLTFWEISHRWANLAPRSWRLSIPLHVRDNFRVLMDAVLNCQLACETLSIEKYQGDDKEEAKFYIRYWLREVEECIEGVKFDQELLKWARITRWDFADWCERKKIPLPEFWFPPGWAREYDWREESLIDSLQTSVDASAPSSEGNK